MRDHELVNKLRTHLEVTRKIGLYPGKSGIWAVIEQASDRIEAQAKEIEKLRGQVPRWIPVDERLPEVWRNDETAELVNYMIYSPDFGVDIGNYHAKAKKWLCMALPCTVTHWMPLPSGPEVE